MSITIKGINKPKDCISCPFCDIGFNGNYCVIKNEHIDNPNTVPTWCPVSDFPSNKRLIDFLNLVGRFIDKATTAAADGAELTWNDAVDIVFGMPAAVEAEE